MVARAKRARHDPEIATRAVLGLFGIDDPTDDQMTGAVIVSQFMLRVINFLSPKE